jgi:hypothetical protein
MPCRGASSECIGSRRGLGGQSADTECESSECPCMHSSPQRHQVSRVPPPRVRPAASPPLLLDGAWFEHSGYRQVAPPARPGAALLTQPAPAAHHGPEGLCPPASRGRRPRMPFMSPMRRLRRRAGLRRRQGASVRPDRARRHPRARAQSGGDAATRAAASEAGRPDPGLHGQRRPSVRTPGTPARAFTYTERGLLDRTNVRLFTRYTFRRLFELCSLRVRRGVVVTHPVRERPAGLAAGRRRPLLARSHIRPDVAVAVRLPDGPGGGGGRAGGHRPAPGDPARGAVRRVDGRHRAHEPFLMAHTRQGRLP